MTERRARGAGPAGRGDRRSSRADRSRPERSATGSTAVARNGKRGVGRRPATGRSSTPRDKHERTIFGLSTGRAVILAAVLCALALTLAVPMRTYLSQRAESERLTQERTELEDNLATLRDRRAQQQDPAYIKSEARGRLRLVMPGETPYIVQVPGIEQPPVPPQATRPSRPDPWYTELWRSMSAPQPAASQPEAPHASPEGAPR